MASRFGHWSCNQHTNAHNPKNILSRTLRSCDAGLTKAQRDVAPCEPLYSNEKTYDNATSRALNTTAQIPVEYILRYRDGRPEVTHRARIRFLNAFTGNGRAIEVVSDKGVQLCRGSHIVKGKTMFFALTCDYEYHLTSPLFRPTGYVDQNGLFLPQFETRLIEGQTDERDGDGSFPGSSTNQRNQAVKARGLELILRTPR